MVSAVQLTQEEKVSLWQKGVKTVIPPKYRLEVSSKIFPLKLRPQEMFLFNKDFL